MRMFWATDVFRATRAPPFIRAALPALVILEDWKYLGEGPAIRSVPSPPVVVTLHAPHPHHGIDAAAPAKYVTEDHVEFAIL
jgi:hypothetical protein